MSEVTTAPAPSAPSAAPSAPASAPSAPSAPASGAATATPSSTGDASKSTAPSTAKTDYKSIIEGHKAEKAAAGMKTPESDTDDATRATPSATQQSAEKTAEPAAEAKEGAKAPEADKEAAQVDVTVPAQVREALKVIPDKKLREQLGRDYILSRDYQKVFPSISEAKEYRRTFPSMEVAKQVSFTAQRAQALRDQFVGGSHEEFVRALHDEHPDGFNNLVDYIADPASLRNGRPAAYARVANHALGTAAQILHNQAQKTNDPAFAAAADILMQVFPNAAKGAQENRRPDGPQLPPEVQHRLQRLDSLERQTADQERERKSEAIRTTTDKFNSTLDTLASKHIKTADPDELLPPDVRERAQKDIVEALRGRLRDSEAIRGTTIGLIERGDAEGILKHLSTQAENLLADTADEPMRFWLKQFEGKQEARAQKQKQVAARRDVGAAGAATAVPQTVEIETRGKTLKQVAREFVAARRASKG